MVRRYFRCPNTGTWFSTTVTVSNEGRPVWHKAYCRHCETLHTYKGSEARKWKPAERKKRLSAEKLSKEI